MPTPGFHLRKWYADCITPAGDVLVCYVATLRWGPLRAAYAATLERDAAGSLHERQTLRGGRVVTDPGAVHVDAPALALTGVWSGGNGTAAERLWASDTGSITWQVLTLAATADVGIAGRRHRGTGYVDVVTLTVPPWRLPFRHMHWGRHVADDATSGSTWLSWGDEGDGNGTDTRLERGWAWHGGAAVEDARPTPATTAMTILRDHRVADTLFGPVRGLARLLPRGVRDLHECKRVGRATRPDGTTGWVVDERVTR